MDVDQNFSFMISPCGEGRVESVKVPRRCNSIKICIVTILQPGEGGSTTAPGQVQGNTSQICSTGINNGSIHGGGSHTSNNTMYYEVISHLSRLAEPQPGFVPGQNIPLLFLNEVICSLGLRLQGNLGLMKENKEFSRSSVLIGKLFSRSRINNRRGDDIS